MYRARKRSKKVKIHLDLTKRRLDLLILANSIMKAHPRGNGYAFADITCRLRVKIGEKYKFFDSEDELKHIRKDNEGTEDPNGLDNPDFA